MSEIIFNPPAAVPSLQSQVDNLQTTLASLNQQVIFLQETLQERDQKIAELEIELSTVKSEPSKTSFPLPVWEHRDNTLTLVGALIKLYQFIVLPGKAA